MKLLKSLVTPGRLLFAFVFVTGALFLIEGKYSSAVAVLLVPVFVRAGIIVVDVFWTSFTGMPLVRAHPVQKPGSAGALNPAETVGGLRGLPALPRPIREEHGRGLSPFAALPRRRLAPLRDWRARRRVTDRPS